MKQHQPFIIDFSDLKPQMGEEEVHARSVVFINRVVVDWLTHHINKTDKRLGTYLKAKMRR